MAKKAKATPKKTSKETKEVNETEEKLDPVMEEIKNLFIDTPIKENMTKEERIIYEAAQEKKKEARKAKKALRK